jgi:phage gpG-like protein
MVTVNKMFRRRTGQTVGVFSVDVDMASVQSVINAVNLSLGGGMLRGFMEHQVHPYLQEQIIDRFAYNGGRDSTWAPLKESTKRIRHAMGQYDDWAINDRTGEMMEHLVGSREITTGLSTAQIAVPGDQGDEVMAKKLRTAQHGASEWNDGFGAFVDTPARPVLVMTSEDRQAIMVMLQVYIMNSVAGIHNLGPLGSL